MNVFNKGDRVKVVKCKVHKNCEHIGEIFPVSELLDIRNNVYKLKGCGESFFGDELELVELGELGELGENKKFSKRDLEDGYIVTYRNGDVRIVSGENLRALDNKSIVFTLDAYNEDLTCEGSSDLDIMEVQRPIEYEIIFKRKEEILNNKEREFLKQYIKIIESLNNGKVNTIRRTECCIIVYTERHLSYKIELGCKFGNLELARVYKIEELGL